MEAELGAEPWRGCVEWLVRCEVLRPDHPTTYNHTARVEELAHTLRDGVVLCRLADALAPGRLDLSPMHGAPHATRCLSIQNINIFLKACRDIFHMSDNDLFESCTLFDLTGFDQVLRTLSVLSNTTFALHRIPCGFIIPPVGNRTSSIKLQIREADARRSIELRENASPSTHRESIRQDAIYERLVRKEVGSQIKTKEKRDYIIEEIIASEKSYLQDVLKTILQSFMKPLKAILSPYDSEAIFGDIEKLTSMHENLLSDLQVSLLPNSGIYLSDVFLNYYQRFLMYGNYCANLPKALELLKNLNDTKIEVRSRLRACQGQLRSGKFYLQDMLVVPMQHILKYRLLLERLYKDTPPGHTERGSLQKAYEAMSDVNSYINEVKRDREALQVIEKIESTITDLQMPGNKILKDFGRLHKDDELRIKFPDQKIGSRYVFVFDQVLLLCKPLKDGMYACQEVLELSSYIVKDMQVNSRWGHHWRLVHKIQNVEYIIYARNKEHKHSWMQATLQAQENAEPKGAKDNGHRFVVQTVDHPTMCSLCKTSLKGLIMQGYSCYNCGQIVHNMCIKNADVCITKKQNNDSCGETSTRISRKCNYKHLEKYAWFASLLDRKGADAMLAEKERGTFMLRIRPQSSSEDSIQMDFAISLKTARAVKHMLVFKSIHNGVTQYCLSEARYFSSIIDLINFYGTCPLDENYDEFDEFLRIPYKGDYETPFSTSVFKAIGEQDSDINDYLDMDQGNYTHMDLVGKCDNNSNPALSSLSNECNLEIANQYFEHNLDDKYSHADNSSQRNENAVFENLWKKKELEEENDLSTTSVNFDSNNMNTSVENRKSNIEIAGTVKKCELTQDSSTQTEKNALTEVDKEGIENFGRYVTVSLTLFNNPHTVRKVQNEIRKIIHESSMNG